MRKITGLIAILLTVWFGIGCAASTAVGKKGKEVGPDGVAKVSAETRADFEVAVKKYQAARKAGTAVQDCKDLADEFEEVSSDAEGFAPALFNRAVILDDCDMEKEAQKAFRDVLKVDPKHQLSITYLATYDHGKGNINDALRQYKKAIKVQPNALEAVPAYVNLAAIEREQGEYKKSQTNLRRALAIDSSYLPAFFHLAMLYYDIAIKEERKSFFQLAELVCSQAIQLEGGANYAPIYNVWGMIKLKKDEIVAAANKFKQAFEYDPDFFEAYMNFGSITLNFRGFEDAQMAFSKALELNPDSYEAHIGLGVALRGLQQFDEAKKHYAAAKKLDSKRSDVYFNEGVLEMDYVGTGDEKSYKKAIKIFEKFLDHVSERERQDPDGKKGPDVSWEEKAKKRIETCKKNIEMLREAEEAMREMEKLKKEMEERRKREEEEKKKVLAEAKKLEEGGTPPAEGEAAKKDEGKGKEEGKKEEDDKSKEADKSDKKDK